MASASTNDIEFRSVTKNYGAVTAVTDINLNVPKGAFLALLGPSGCGKTTCLRMIGGFEQPSEGAVLIDGREMNGVPAYRRPVNMVFQHYALFPHFNVEQNVAYGLRQMRPRIAAAEINRRAAEALEMVRLGGFAKRRIHEMSGGQQQRVALARAIVNRPSVLLLDEPLAALDKKLRSAMQIELQTLQRELGITFVLVTHDQEEALSMADVVCVMSAGRIRQLGTPQEVYDRPADLFVADFVGKTNRIGATMEAGGTRLRLGDGSALAANARPGLATGDVIVAIRPEAIRLTRAAVGSASFAGTVTHRIFLGSSAEYAVTVPGLGDFLVTADRRGMNESDLVEPGEAIFLGFDPDMAHVFPAQVSSAQVFSASNA
ncbi:spermidine/putrescine ABC transporter ATP-binding protein (plasmid) [Rhizobium leguminosarum bv. trifolii CB782]|uniref:ABC transporter ATP-binding protein n=2 Tax=Rhizobium hidalgonense TaxID=1538159 RepID=UPI0003E2F178|nr:ABC transporter ATP-binding protein [Rhizobium hidalgonense]AHG49685.1 spermidine/putrescine ABC transporter ATP-binding protein [Rhizobium leguminosarum bv. trifolii CB782]QKK27535.1 ABC transporter ATP-binding protein [Rhizobium hidalgonense]RWX14419.1 ABC transporter ATP-binding protein [Rhizobium hidalgonense]